MAEILSTEEVAPGGGANVVGERLVARRSNYEGTMTTLTKSLVKGSGQLSGERGASGAPLMEGIHSSQILSKSHQAILDSRATAVEGRWNSANVARSINPELWKQAPKQYQGLGMMLSNDAEVRKSMDTAMNKSFTAREPGTVRGSLRAGAF